MINNKPETTAERVAAFMERSPLHALFIRQAADSYASKIKENETIIRSSMKNSLINPVAWVATAYDWDLTPKE